MPKKKPGKKPASKKYPARKAPKKVSAKKGSAGKSAPKKTVVKKTVHTATVPKTAVARKAIKLAALKKADLVRMKKHVESDSRLAGIFSYFNTFLQASEYEVIQMMVRAKVWSGPIPPNPGGSGNAEFGTLDYDLNNPGSNPFLQGFADLWKFVVGSLPVTQMNAANYNNLQRAIAPSQPGLVASDGTWFSQSTYGAADLGWTEAAFLYVYYYAKGSFAPFAQSPATVRLTGSGSNTQVKIALVGDWGTGIFPNGPAGPVMNAILASGPDYIIHLGDVYYSGTIDEEQNKLVGLWPSPYVRRSFTLNSNHEMYDGAFGYFKVLTNPIFGMQNQTSYFALQYGNSGQPGGPWTIVGLDSAYFSTSPFVMNGSIQEPGVAGGLAQPQFLQKLVQGGLSPLNTIVLSHHNPISMDGSALVTDELNNNLWAQVTAPGALNGTPRAWYWGHVHNGIVYPNPTFTKNNVYGRCLGHGALPFGDAWGLATVPKSQVQAYANTARPNPNPTPLMMNGFILLTITQSGQVTETFYQQDGSQAPWVKPFTYQLGKSSAAAGSGGE